MVSYLYVSLSIRTVNFTRDTQNNEIQEIPLQSVRTQILAKVIEFASHYSIEPMCEIAKVDSFALNNLSRFS
jgi:hypothetical protein